MKLFKPALLISSLVTSVATPSHHTRETAAASSKLHTPQNKVAFSIDSSGFPIQQSLHNQPKSEGFQARILPQLKNMRGSSSAYSKFIKNFEKQMGYSLSAEDQQKIENNVDKVFKQVNQGFSDYEKKRNKTAQNRELEKILRPLHEANIQQCKAALAHEQIIEQATLFHPSKLDVSHNAMSHCLLWAEQSNRLLGQLKTHGNQSHKTPGAKEILKELGRFGLFSAAACMAYLYKEYRNYLANIRPNVPARTHFVQGHNIVFEFTPNSRFRNFNWDQLPAVEHEGIDTSQYETRCSISFEELPRHDEPQRDSLTFVRMLKNEDTQECWPQLFEVSQIKRWLEISIRRHGGLYLPNRTPVQSLNHFRIEQKTKDFFEALAQQEEVDLHDDQLQENNIQIGNQQQGNNQENLQNFEAATP